MKKEQLLKIFSTKKSVNSLLLKYLGVVGMLNLRRKKMAPPSLRAELGFFERFSLARKGKKYATAHTPARPIPTEDGKPIPIPVSPFVRKEILNRFALLRDHALINRVINVDCRGIAGEIFTCEWDTKNKNRVEGVKGRVHCKKSSCIYSRDTFANWLGRIDFAIARLEVAIADNYVDIDTRSKFMLLRNQSADPSPAYDERRQEMKDEMNSIIAAVQLDTYKKFTTMVSLYKQKITLIDNMAPFVESYLNRTKLRIDAFYYSVFENAKPPIEFVSPPKDIVGLLSVNDETLLGKSLDNVRDDSAKKVDEINRRRESFTVNEENLTIKEGAL